MGDKENKEMGKWRGKYGTEMGQTSRESANAMWKDEKKQKKQTLIQYFLLLRFFPIKRESKTTNYIFNLRASKNSNSNFNYVS